MESTPFYRLSDNNIFVIFDFVLFFQMSFFYPGEIYYHHP